MNKNKDELVYDQSGEMMVHQQLSQSYQSGVIDQEEAMKQEKSKKFPPKQDRKSYY
ncbi:hypothetical protein [Guptibacillus algicola]|uniref:hypothetical protein n=1 Tax=Guptibacillus algicola TaxID=225844 RepID=UPI001CD3E206|nr:hypothetical protein [Alkalihalobacillus algicola]MCA0986353.1 hypothetical protein [Alkalihalobacillus algicola]